MKSLGDKEYKIKMINTDANGQPVETEANVYVQVLRNEAGHIILNRYVDDEPSQSFIFNEEIGFIVDTLRKLVEEEKKKNPLKDKQFLNK